MNTKLILRGAGLAVAAILMTLGFLSQNTVAAAAINVYIAESGGTAYVSTDLVSGTAFAPNVNVGATDAVVIPPGAVTTGSVNDTDNYHMQVSPWTGSGRLEVALGAQACSDATTCFMWVEANGAVTDFTGWTYVATDDTDSYKLKTAAGATDGKLMLYFNTGTATDSWFSTALVGSAYTTIFTWTSPQAATQAQFAFLLNIPTQTTQVTGYYGTVMYFKYTPL
jgi:hypothetical protein